MKPTLLLMTLIWVPFLSIFAFANPALTDRIGDSYPHIAFHLVTVALLVVALVVLRRIRGGNGPRSQRVLTGVLLVTIPLAIVGNLAEFVTAVDRLAADGWESRLTPEMFEEGAHAMAANLTIPALMLSMVSVLVLAGTEAYGRRRRLESVS